MSRASRPRVRPCFGAPLVDPWIPVAFAAGMGFALLLDPFLHWLVNSRFRLSRWVSRLRAASGAR